MQCTEIDCMRFEPGEGCTRTDGKCIRDLEDNEYIDESSEFTYGQFVALIERLKSRLHCEKIR